MVTSRQTVCITTLKKGLDPDLTESLLFMHAISGCDTTSRPYGIGKATVLMKYAVLKTTASVFKCPSSSPESIEKAGEDALLKMYGCTSATLNSARVAKFSSKVSTSTTYVPPEKLPPTSHGAIFHSKRTYHQVQAWLGNDLSPEEWGWKLSSSGDGLVPIKMTQAAAPERLLKIIRCNCVSCERKSCTCRKNALLCTPACGNCKGVTCTNKQIQTNQDDDDDELLI